MPDTDDWGLRHKIVVENGDAHITASQDVEPILNRNVALQNSDHKRDKDMHLIGSIPCVMVEYWLRHNGVNIQRLGRDDFGTWMKRILNDPDYRKFKTTSERI